MFLVAHRSAKASSGLRATPSPFVNRAAEPRGLRHFGGQLFTRAAAGPERRATDAYPEPEARCESLVYTNAPQINRASDEGAVIRNQRGRALVGTASAADRPGSQ
jgi:hypothetical protein